MLGVILIVLILCILTVKYILWKRNLLKYVRHLPSLKEYPIIGVAHHLIGKNGQQIMETMISHVNIETPAKGWFGPFLVIFIHKPNDTQTVLTSRNCLDKPYIYRLLPNKTGLFTSEVNLWKQYRKLLNPTFNINILMSFVPIFNAKTNIMIEKMQQKIDKDYFDILPITYACTLDMVCATTLGSNVDVQRESNKELLDALEKFFGIYSKRIANIWMHPDFIYKLTRNYQTECFVFKIANDLIKTIRKEREIIFHTKNEDYGNEKSECCTGPTIFIDQLLKLHKEGRIDDTNLIDQVQTIIVTGTETTSVTVSNVILMLAMHQDIQDKVFNEVNEICYSNEEYIDYETTMKCNYLDMVIKETFRLLPVAPFLLRKCTANTPISNCTIPSGAYILISAYHMHRNKNVWGNNSDKFNPNNFLPEEVAKRHTYNFLPFSGGPRNCIGIKYADISVKIMLVKLIRQFKFYTNLKMEDLVLKWQVTLLLDNKILVKIVKRNS